MAMSRSSNFLITTVPIASRSPIAWLARQGAQGRQARLAAGTCCAARRRLPILGLGHVCGLARLSPRNTKPTRASQPKRKREVKMTSLRLWHVALGGATPCPCNAHRFRQAPRPPRRVRPIPGPRARRSRKHRRKCSARPPAASSTSSPALRRAGSRRRWCSNTIPPPINGSRSGRCGLPPTTSHSRA